MTGHREGWFGPHTEADQFELVLNDDALIW